jgi:hypothetical protein
MTYVIESVMKMSLTWFEIPTECNGNVLFIEEILHSGFMQTKIDEFTNDTIADQSKAKIFRKVQTRMPKDLNDNQKKRMDLFTIDEEEYYSKYFRLECYSMDLVRRDWALDESSFHGN